MGRIAVGRTQRANQGALSAVSGGRGEPRLQLLDLHLQLGVLVLQITDVVDGCENYCQKQILSNH